MKAIRNATLLSLPLAALVLLAAAPAAYADSTESFSTSFTTTQTDFSNVAASLAQFDPSLGTLVSVQITLVGAGQTDITATANDPDSPTVFSALSTDLALALTASSIPAIDTLESMSGGPSVSALDPITVDYGTPYDSGSQTLSGLAGSQTFNSDLSSFIGLGSIGFDLAGAATTTESFSGGNFTAGQTTDAGAEVTITYDYSTAPPPVPEPDTLVLFGTGLLGLAGMLRFKFLQSR